MWWRPVPERAVDNRAANRYRRVALAGLRSIETELASADDRAAALGRIPVLVKRTSLAVHPRAEIAELSGEPWLAFLDASVGGRDFREGAGRLLPTLAYAAPASVAEVPTSDVIALVKLVERWIRRHRVRV